MTDELRIGPQWRVTLADVRSLADAYGWTLASGEIVPLGGAVNGVARIQTSIGNLVIRVHRPWTDPARLTAVHAVQERLRTHGIPIPAEVRTAAGGTFVTIPGDPAEPPHHGAEHDRLVEVTEAVVADPVQETHEHAGHVLTTLAPLQNALTTVDPASLPQPTYAAHADVLEALAWLDETDATFAACAGHSDFTRANTRELVEHLREDLLAPDP